MANHRSTATAVLFATLACVAACSSSSAGPIGDDSTPPNHNDGDDGSSAGNQGTLGSPGGPAAAPDASTTAACVPPDMLIALDRTMTMLRTPAGDIPADTAAGHATSKWFMAIDAVKTLTAPPFDTTIRFGLELWPKREPGCDTVSQALAQTATSNPSCEEGEMLVTPALSTSDLIASALDPEKTPLCFSTPTGTALEGAKDELAKNKQAGKGQYVVLLTDGADWDQTCATPNPIQVVDELAAEGISTVVVGFSSQSNVTGGVGAGFLNDMACAGGVSIGFPKSCTKTAAGTYRYDPKSTSNVFYSATDTSQLVEELTTLAKTVCCGCVR